LGNLANSLGQIHKPFGVWFNFLEQKSKTQKTPCRIALSWS